MEEWPILEDDETYVPPDITRALMHIEQGEDELKVARFNPGVVECMESLSDRPFVYDPAGDSEFFTIGGESVDVIRGILMDVSAPNETDDYILTCIVIHCPDEDTRTFVLDLMTQCVARNKREAIKKDLPKGIEKIEKRRAERRGFIRETHLIAKRKGLPASVGHTISTFAGKRRRKTRKVSKRKARRTHRARK